ncbi:MAG: hypothetical protein COB71_02855 [Thiotrichales bacterium]|nr:MAG: hypothetical protein COB71_02855 [Thiotrichales bacterium]
MAKILIVDDDLHTRNQLTTILSAAGHDMLDSASGEAAIELLQKKKADLVVLDQMMPGMSGTDTAHELHELGTPFLFCSGSTELETLKAAMSLGALNYIVKPFSPADVVLSVDGALERLKNAEKDSDVKTAVTFLMGRFDLSHKMAVKRLTKMSRDSGIKTPELSKQINETADLINRR